MKLQISPKRIIADAITVWNQPGPEVDIVMDLTSLTFRPGMVTTMYVFHALEMLFPEEAVKAVANWRSLLTSNGGTLHTINDDFEYIARAFVGGDIDIDMLNAMHNHANQCTRDSVAKMMHEGGFGENDTHIWIEGAPEEVERKHYELVMTSKKNGK